MKNDQKTDNRGKYGILAWQEAKKAGGVAYTPEQINAILEERDDGVMTRGEVQSRISAYLMDCLTVSQDEDTGEVNYIWKRNPTKSGLALALGLSPQTLCDYVRGCDRHGSEYKFNHPRNTKQRVDTADFDLIEKAYGIIEDFYEAKLGDNRNNSGVIFWLLNRQNGRWSNVQELDITARKGNDDEQTRAEIAERYGTSVSDYESDQAALPFDGEEVQNDTSKRD